LHSLFLRVALVKKKKYFSGIPQATNPIARGHPTTWRSLQPSPPPGNGPPFATAAGEHRFRQSRKLIQTNPGLSEKAAVN
jgi:hypothetical protein